MDPFQLQPLGVGQTIDAGFKIYRDRFATLVKAAAVVLVPLAVVTVLVQLSLVGGAHTTTTVQSDGTTITTTSASGAAIGGAVVLAILSLFATVLVTAACFKTASDVYSGTESDWSGSLRFGFRRIWALIGLLILHGLLLTIGFVLCIIPGVWLYAALSVATPALLFEGIGPGRALSRSRNLVRGRWWPVAGALVLVNLIVIAVTSVVAGVLVAIVFHSSSSDTSAVVANSILRFGVQVFTAPISAAVVSVIYFDLRVRKEAFDLQLLAQRMDTTITPDASNPMPWTPGYDRPPWEQQALGPPPGWTPPAAPPPPPGWSPSPDDLTHE